MFFKLEICHLMKKKKKKKKGKGGIFWNRVKTILARKCSIIFLVFVYCTIFGMCGYFATTEPDKLVNACTYGPVGPCPIPRRGFVTLSASSFSIHLSAKQQGHRNRIETPICTGHNDKLHP